MILFTIVFSKILAILLVLASIALTIAGTALSSRSNKQTTNNLYVWAFVSFLLAMVWAFAGKGIEDIENRKLTTTTQTTIQHR